MSLSHSAVAPLRLGLVGCGRIAERGWVPAIAKARSAELAAVADREVARCAALAPGIEAFDGAAALAASGRVDAVIVATPAEAHLQDAAAAAAAGLPTLIEKPPAADAAGARALSKLVPAPWLAFNRRFDERIRQLRARGSEAGELTLRLRFDYRRDRWDPYTVRDDALLDVGPHLLDLARWLTGAEIERVRTPLLLPERARLELELSRGSATVECNADAPYRELIEVTTERRPVGTVQRSAIRGTLGRLRGAPDPFLASLVAQLEAFCAVVRHGGTSELATVEDGLAVMKAIEAARRAAAEGETRC